MKSRESNKEIEVEIGSTHCEGLDRRWQMWWRRCARAVEDFGRVGGVRMLTIEERAWVCRMTEMGCTPDDEDVKICTHGWRAHRDLNGPILRRRTIPSLCWRSTIRRRRGCRHGEATRRGSESRHGPTGAPRGPNTIMLWNGLRSARKS